MKKAAERLTNAQCRGITPAVPISLLDEERTLKHLLEQDSLAKRAPNSQAPRDPRWSQG